MTDIQDSYGKTKDDEEKIEEKTPEDHVMITTMLISWIMIAAALWTYSEITPVVVKVNEKDILKYQLLNIGSFIILMTITILNDKIKIFGSRSMRGIS